MTHSHKLRLLFSIDTVPRKFFVPGRQVRIVNKDFQRKFVQMVINRSKHRNNVVRTHFRVSIQTAAEENDRRDNLSRK